MTDIFVDTSGWGNLVDISQPYHQLTTNIYLKTINNQYKLITSNYIINELTALLSSPLRIPRVKIIAFIESIKKSPYVRIIHIDKDIDNLAWNLFKQREDKNWSLVDCSSFILMNKICLYSALTTDHHFEQAGFIRLLKNE